MCGNREILEKCSARGGPGSDVLGCFAYVVQRCFVMFSGFLMAKAKHVFFFEKQGIFAIGAGREEVSKGGTWLCFSL